MNPWFTFVLGLLVGWLIEWLIDYFYWRRRFAARAAGYSSQSRSAAIGSVDAPPVAQSIPDDLKIIRGIGPVIERKLNEAGVHTFEQLGKLTPADLRRILGDAIERLADEESLLQQARDLARGK